MRQIYKCNSITEMEKGVKYMHLVKDSTPLEAFTSITVYLKEGEEVKIGDQYSVTIEKL